MKILWTLVVLHFGLEKTNMSPTEFGLKYLETESAAEGEADQSKLIFKWLSGNNYATRKKFEKAGRDVPGLLELFDWPGFELLENKPIAQERIDEIVKPYSHLSGGIQSWYMPGPLPPRSEYKSQLWSPVIARSYPSPLTHWKVIDGFLILLALVREAEMNKDTESHLLTVFDLYRALPTVASSAGFRHCKELLFIAVEAIHNRCRLSRELTHVIWDAIDLMSSEEIQNEMPDYLSSTNFWTNKLEKRHLDVVTRRKVTPQRLLDNPFDEEDEPDLYMRTFRLDGRRTKTLKDIERMPADIKELTERRRRDD